MISVGWGQIRDAVMTVTMTGCCLMIGGRWPVMSGTR